MNIENELNNLVSTAEYLRDNHKSIEELGSKMADTIKNGGRVIFSGVGSSAKLIDYAMEEIIDWYGFEDGEFLTFFQLLNSKTSEYTISDRKNLEDDAILSFFLATDLQLSEKDMLVAVSMSGRTEFIINSLNIAKNLGAKTAIICHDKNALDNLSVDYSVVVPNKNDLSQITLINVVLSLLIEKVNIDLGRTLEDIFLFVNIGRGKETEYSIKSAVKLIDGLTEQSASEQIKLYGFKEMILMNRNGISFEEARKIIDTNKYSLASKIKN